MSTTFIVKVPSIKTYEDGEEVEVKVAFRSNGVRWLEPLAQLLPDDTEVIAIDNSPQGIYTIGDIKNKVKGNVYGRADMTMKRSIEELERLARDVIALNTPDNT